MNRDDCEYMSNFKNMTFEAREFFKSMDKNPETHSYFSYSIKCDYFVDDKTDWERFCVESDARTEEEVMGNGLQ
jgi:hypothetical protein